ncbi:phenylalanine-trna ligase [Plasmopara halstedii]|uniref:phenylalanine--tRNA ligase n=1 Tax=Plasmopara halstedii TaxID=4781 RepID=A0A0P1AYB6_PLAHL|nr:phenylalanine-trna ligase [Plasmopara halstedii]CEG46474.1 phenylalanine-trna ligase [Plasmopara halstedii]|eukprot:XP_024582843.1 phenylalanine-trna ligase [Plasmopara halstedii]
MTSMIRHAANGLNRWTIRTRHKHTILSAQTRIACAASTSQTNLEWMKNRDPFCNVSASIAAKIGVNLHRQPNHPLHIIKTKIEKYFETLHQCYGGPKFTIFDNLDPVVTTYDCFDSMLVPKDHVSRKITDTYYVDQNRVLRAHTSAHEVATMKQGYTSFLISGDVYRRDEIDASHYPVFHQMEGVRIFTDLDVSIPRSEKVTYVSNELKQTVEGMAKDLFGDVDMRWVDAYFPFTEPSFELEIFFNGDWLEVLGCGVLHHEIVRNAGLGENVGWAFGLGLERLAMVLFDIPDIRLFWSQDKRFISQFQDGKITRFKPYSKYPACFKDVSFWHDDNFHENNLFEVVRDVAGDMVEQVAVVDEFTHPKTQRTSKCYRITYRHMDRNLTNSEIDGLQEIVRAKIVQYLGSPDIDLNGFLLLKCDIETDAESEKAVVIIDTSHFVARRGRDTMEANDWKRRYHKETKVNKELGRRLRETKCRLEKEIARTQMLNDELLRYKSLEYCDELTKKPSLMCSNCERLEAELAKLQFMLRTAENSSRVKTLSVVTSQYEDSKRNGIVFASDCSKVDNLDAKEIAPVALDDNCEVSQRIEEFNSNQLDDDCYSLTDMVESSLGDLFKYAVVLAGPVPIKPKAKSRLSLTDRFKPLELPRIRNVQECMEQTEHQGSANESNRPRSAPNSKGQATSPKGGSIWPLKRQSQTIINNVNEARVPSPLRRVATGFFSSFVPNGLRGGTPSSAPTTPPLPPTDSVKATTPPRPNLVPASKLLCVYPPHAGEVQELEGLIEICFPYGDDPPSTSDFSLPQLKRSLQERHRTYRSLDSTFVLTIASASNPTEITYAICVRCPLFPDKEDDVSETLDPASLEPQTLADGPTQCCLCLLSPYPFFGLFFKVLYGIAVLWNTKRREALMAKKEKFETDQVESMLEKPLGMLDFVEVFQGVMERLKKMPIPSMGGWSRMLLSPKITHLAFHRPHSSSLLIERRHLVLEYAAPTLFGLLSVDQVLFLLGCLCSERKVLVVSDHVNIVSSCVLALITLLHPLQWAGPVITVLPPRLNELLEAPVPLIAGRVSINCAMKENFSTLEHPMRDVIEMNMDQNALHMHDEDLVTYHELKLPEVDELVHELEPFSALLFGKHEAPDFPTVAQDEACKIMCARIHHHIESICTLAMIEREEGTRNEPNDFDETSDHASSDSSSPSRGSITRLGADRRCSAMVADYINRFQETQMFSMLKLHAQGAQNESDDGELELELDDSENDGSVNEEYHYGD